MIQEYTEESLRQLADRLKEMEGDPVQACCKMMQQWLNGEGRKPVSWLTLKESLIDTGFLDLAETLQEILRN